MKSRAGLLGRAEQGVLRDRLAGLDRERGLEVDGGDAEQVGEGGAGRPCLRDEGGQQEGGSNGVPQRPVGLAAACEALDLGAQAELGCQGAEAVLGAELEVARQAEGVDQGGRDYGRVAAVPSWSRATREASAQASPGPSVLAPELVVMALGSRPCRWHRRPGGSPVPVRRTSAKRLAATVLNHRHARLAACPPRRHL